MTDEEYNRRERECIMQYDGGMTQRQAEYRAAVDAKRQDQAALDSWLLAEKLLWGPSTSCRVEE